MLQTPETLHQQSRGNQQHNRDREFAYDEHSPDTVATPASPEPRPPSLSDSVNSVLEMNCRHQAKNNSG